MLVLWRHLDEQASEDLAVLQVGFEVAQTARSARLLQVVVDPAHEQLLGRQSTQVLEGLVRLEQEHQFRVLRERYVREQPDLDHLPDEAEHQVRRAVVDV